MSAHHTGLRDRVALVTGGARRIGAAIVQALHDAGMHVVIHCHRSRDEADALCQQLNAVRADSAVVLQCDLQKQEALAALVEQAAIGWDRLDALINNASSFYPTPLGTIDPQAWDDLLGSNLAAPLWLSQAAAPWLKTQGGSIINIADIHVRKPLPHHAPYLAAKGGLQALTRALALDLAPEVRVNAVAPGAILLPEVGVSAEDADAVSKTQQLSAQIPLGRMGEPADIAAAVRFLLSNAAAYISGQTLSVDGGWGL